VNALILLAGGHYTVSQYYVMLVTTVKRIGCPRRFHAFLVLGKDITFKTRGFCLTKYWPTRQYQCHHRLQETGCQVPTASNWTCSTVARDHVLVVLSS
jgi:hypothetical protein